jgi:hypothetical protein
VGIVPDIEEIRNCRGVVLPDELVRLRPLTFRTAVNIKKEMLLLAVLLKGIDLYEDEIRNNRKDIEEYSKKHNDLPDHDWFHVNETEAFLMEYFRFKQIMLYCFDSLPYLVFEMTQADLASAEDAFVRLESKLGEDLAAVKSLDMKRDGFSKIRWDD